MSYDGKLMRRAMVRFEEAKQRRADALHARERAVYAAVPRIAEIDAALRETMSKLISSALRRGTDHSYLLHKISINLFSKGPDEPSKYFYY